MGSATGTLVLISTLFGFVYGQNHQFVQPPPFPYPFGYNPGNVVNTQGSYPQQPCDYPRPTSLCNNFPCYQNAYGQNQWDFSKQVNARPTFNQQNDPYANVPVEIIDVNQPRQFSGVQPYGQGDPYANVPQFSRVQPYGQGDPYANVPVQIIDLTPQHGVYPTQQKPQVKTSSSSAYTVSGGQSSNTQTIEGKPINAVITRSFTPEKENPSISINYVDGQLVTTTEEVTTTIEEAEEEKEEDDEPGDVNSWI